MSRFRSRNSYVNGPSLVSGQYYSNCSSSAYWSYNAPTYPLKVGLYESIEDTVVPGFRKKVAEGQVFFNPLVRVSKFTGIPTGNGYVFTKKATDCISPYTYNYKGSLTGPRVAGFAKNNSGLYDATTGGLVADEIISSSDISDCITLATTACLNDRGRNKDTNLFESLAEVNQSLAILEDLIKQVRTIVAKRRTHPDAIRARAKGVADLWLLSRYGILPLINDIQAVLKGMQASVGKVRQTSRGYSRLSRNGGRNIRWNSADGNWQYDILLSTTQHISVRAMSLDEYTATFSDNIGFTAKGLITLPWELTKKSFVVDWFVNVGDFLGALIPSPSYTQLGSCITVSNERETTISIVDESFTTAGSALYSLDTRSSGSVKAVTSTLQRIPQLGTPGLRIKANFGFDRVPRILDAISLLTQQLTAR